MLLAQPKFVERIGRLEFGLDRFEPGPDRFGNPSAGPLAKVNRILHPFRFPVDNGFR